MSEWISVEERLPEIDTIVLVCVRYEGRVFLKMSHRDKYHCSLDWFWSIDDADLKDAFAKPNAEVTHWMPLPDLPVLEEMGSPNEEKKA